MKNVFRYTMLALAAMLLVVMPAQAQINSTTATVTLNYTVTASISVSASPASVTFPSNGGAAQPITITANWNLPATGYSSVKVYAYFGSTTALTGPVSIPTSAVSATINGTADGACTTTDNGFASTCDDSVHGATAVTGITGSNYNNGSSSTTLVLTLASGFNQAGSYSGTLNVVAYAS
jgi:hypothetical protein